MPWLLALTHDVISPRTKWSPFRRRHVQMHFLEWKYFNFKQYFIEICSLGSNWQYVGIGSDNGLAPSRRQAIIWTNVDPVHRIYAAIGGEELIDHQQSWYMYWLFIQENSIWNVICTLMAILFWPQWSRTLLAVYKLYTQQKDAPHLILAVKLRGVDYEQFDKKL